MVHSARRAVISVGGPALLLVVLVGCATTQDEAARLQLNSARTRATQVSTRVTRTNPNITVQRVELLTGHRRSAIVVTLHNESQHPVSDLPISVGVTGHDGRKQYLNAASGLQYFLTHIPAVPAGGSLTWVFTTHRALASSSRPFALVGSEVPPLVPQLRVLPRIVAGAVGGVGRAHAVPEVRVVVHNASSIPQYGLQLYAFAQRSGRAVSAGRATIAHLAGQGTTTLNVALVGSARLGPITLEASPTVFG